MLQRLQLPSQRRAALVYCARLGRGRQADDRQQGDDLPHPTEVVGPVGVGRDGAGSGGGRRVCVCGVERERRMSRAAAAEVRERGGGYSMR